MDHARFASLIEWIAVAGLSGQRELDLLQGFAPTRRGDGGS